MLDDLADFKTLESMKEHITLVFACILYLPMGRQMSSGGRGAGGHGGSREPRVERPPSRRAGIPIFWHERNEEGRQGTRARARLDTSM